MPTTETAPALPETEDAVRLMLGVLGEARSNPTTPPVARLGLTMFLRDYDDAVLLLGQDAVTAYATAWRAARRRETRGVV